MVGDVGFEPTTLWSQTRCATGLRYAPKKGGERGIRTPGTEIPVRQFSKLLVSATHPSLLCDDKSSAFFVSRKYFSPFFYHFFLTCHF